MPEYNVTVAGKGRQKSIVVLFAADAGEARRVGERHGPVIDVARKDSRNEPSERD